MKCFVYNVMGIVLLLSGCAGTSSEFTCNATTSDACLTMQQANEIAKRNEMKSFTKPNVNTLLSTTQRKVNSPSISKRPFMIMSSRPATARALNQPVPGKGGIPWARKPYEETPINFAGGQRSPPPSRVSEQTARLWIAPYIDKDDIFHQPSTVTFVVVPAHWARPLIP